MSESEYEPGFFAKRHEELKERKGKVLEKINSMQAQIHTPERNGDRLERSNTVTENERTKAMLECYKRELAEINDGLEAFEAGTYGICKSCGNTIDRARMESPVRYPRVCTSCLNRT